MKRLLIILSWLCLTVPSYAAITEAQAWKECESTVNEVSTTCTYAGAVTSGNTLVVVQRWGANPAGTITASDPTNGSWACNQLNDTTNGRQIAECWVHNTGNTALTVTCGSGQGTGDLNAHGCDIGEYTNIVTTNAVDNALTGVCPTASTTTPSSGNITTTNASGDLILGIFTFSTNATTTVTEDGNFTAKLTDTLGTAAHDHLHGGERITSATETRAYAPTWSVATVGCIGIEALKAVPSGGATCPQTLLTLGVGC